MTRQKGFTFLETIIAIFILSLVMGIAITSVVVIYRNNSYIWDHAVAVNSARQSIDIMAREIREARTGDDGSYFIEKAGDKEFSFYSDIDNDGKTEKVRYFISAVNIGSETKECVTYTRGGSCSVNFSNFLSGSVISAQVKIYVEGDFGASNEYANISADGSSLGNICVSGCTDCPGFWQGLSTYDVTSRISDNSIGFTVDSSYRVDAQCDWQNPNHAMKVKFELTWTEEVVGLGNELKKSVIEPSAPPATYPEDQKKTTLITSYIRNSPPLFEYFNESGNKIEDPITYLKDINLIKLFLVIDADPNRSPDSFSIESYVGLRNIKNQQQ
jgi:prepilin-type N-terminal cleavage/methylation domain-containing protein